MGTESFETLFEVSHDAVFLLNPDAGAIVDANPAAVELLGYDRDTLLSLSPAALHPDPTALDTLLAGANEDGWTGQLRYRTANGVTVPATVSADRVALSGDGGLLVVAESLREQHDLGRALERTERQFEATFNNPSAFMGLIEPDGTVDRINETALEFVDVDEAAVVGEKFWETPWFDHSTALQRKLKDAIERAAAGEYVRSEFRHVSSDDEVAVIDSIIEPVFVDGSVDELLASGRVITELKEREQRLRDTKRELETLIELLPVGVVVAEANGQIVEWNDAAAELLGGEVPEKARQAASDATWADTGEAVEPEDWPLSRALQGEEITEASVLELAPGGDRRTVMVHGMPIRDDAGDVARAVVTLVDISKRREYQRKLEASNERLEQFAYAASHDLQEPLRMVSSYLQLIEDRYGDELDDDGREFIAFAVDGAERMREMVRGLLEYSRVDSQGDPFEPVNLDEVFAEACRNIHLHIEETGAEIESEPLPEVRGDPGQLGQLFQNLLENAIEYSGAGPPRVRVTAERVNDDWQVSVSDDGIGMDAEESEKVFELFERLHQTDTEGSGIGLALCQRIVERHDGDIWADSTPGGGTTFTFTLPAVDD